MNNAAAHIGTADLHMHTTASDGFAPVDVALDYIAQFKSLDVVAITDHDEIDASLWAYRNRDRYPFDIVPGLEVSSRDGHVLALWVTQPIARDMSLEETVAAIHDHGGLAILAHPFEFFIHRQVSWHYLMQPDVIPQAKVDALEVHNGGAFSPFANQIARRTARKLGMPQVSNSDAHSPAAVGCCITRFNGKSALDLRQAITNGETLAEKGRRWPLMDYWKLLPGTALRKLKLTPETRTPSPGAVGD